MMKYILCMILILAATAQAFAQGGTATRVGSITSLPSTCQSGTATTAADVVENSGIVYVCKSSPPAVWVPQNTLSTDNTYTSNNRFSGPEPFVDALSATYGVRAFPGGTPAGTWATCNGTTVTLTTTNGGYTFVNGDGIEIDGCGPAPTITAPSSITVTASTAGSPTATEVEAAIPTAMAGSSTYNYCVIARDQFGGMTVPTCQNTTTGQETLGLVTYTVTAANRSQDTITVTTSTNNLMNYGSPSSIGTMIHLLVGTGADQMNGWYQVAGRTNNKTFTITNTPVDTRVQGWNSGDTYNQTSGTVSTYVSNHVHLTSVANAWEYLVCGQRPGDGHLHLIGVTKPQGISSGYQDIDFDDYGSPYMDLQTYPRNAVTAGDVQDSQNAICSAGAATPRMYDGTVTAGGGTTALTVSPATSTVTVSASFTTVDATPGILAAINASRATGTSSAVTLLSQPNRFVILYYPLIVPVNSTIWMEGAGIFVYETVNLQGGSSIYGLWGNTGGNTGSLNSGGSTISEQTNEPALYLRGSGNLVSHLNVTGGLANGGLSVLADNCQCELDHDNFGPTGGPATDYLSMSVIWRDTSGTIAHATINYSNFLGGPSQVTDKSWTPLLWLPPGQNGSGPGSGNEAIYVTMYKNTFARRGIAITNNNWSNGPGNWVSDYIYRQGGITPMFLIQNGPANTQFTLHNINMDTEGNPIVANLSVSRAGVYDLSMGQITSNNPVFSGARPSSIKMYEVGTAGSLYQYALPNRNGLHEGSSKGVFPPFDTSGSYVAADHDVSDIFGPVHIPTGESFYFDISPPSSVSAAAAAGGSVPQPATYYYCVAPVGFFSGEGICSLPSGTVTTSSGNQTVNLTWTNPVGSASSNIYRCSTGASCLNDGSINPANWTRTALHVAGASYSDKNASTTATTPGYVSGTGVAEHNKNGSVAPLFACPETAAPSGVSGFDIVYCDSTAHKFRKIENNGAVFNFAGDLSGTTSTITGTALSSSCDSGTASVTGAAVGMPIAVSTIDGTDVGGGFNLRASVTRSNTVTVYVCGTGTPPSKAYNVRVLE